MKTLKHEFVEAIPSTLEPGKLYVSMKYATAIHLCVCGCGNEVVTPLSPTDWKLIFDGEAVSLDPSIGNWNFPCRSHYWIERGKVRMSRRWDSIEIEEGRQRDRKRKKKFFFKKNRENKKKGENGKDSKNFEK